MGSLKAKCGNCNAFFKRGPGQGACRARPPAALLMGVRQHKSPIQGIPGNGAQQADPIVISAFPMMEETGWCREWEPTLELEPAFRRAANGQAQTEAQA